MNDQASRLRAIAGVRGDVPTRVTTIPEKPVKAPALPRKEPVRPRLPMRLAKAVAIASGKGGVGKSNIAANIAATLSNVGRRVALLDADMGCANADLLCGLNPKATLEDVILGNKRLSEVMLKGPGGFRLIPGASGVAHLANLNATQRQALLEQLGALQQVVDVMLIDLGAGIGPDAVEFASSADTVLVVCTPEPTAITDAYGAIKTIATRSQDTDLRLIVNMAGSESEGRTVHQRIDTVARKHLGREIPLAGIVPFDFAIRTAVKRRRLLIQDAPKSRAMSAIRTIARSLDDLFPEFETTSRSGGFLQRLLRPLSGR
jgi:flagellar biosynthesis protein FlhG